VTISRHDSGTLFPDLAALRESSPPARSHDGEVGLTPVSRSHTLARARVRRGLGRGV